MYHSSASLTIPEAPYAIHSGHFDDEGKHVINEGIQCLVSQHPPWEVGHGFELIVYEELRSHRYETYK